MIGPEVRQFRYMPQKTLGKIKNWMQPTFNDESWPQATYGFGTPMEVLIDSSMQKVDGLAAGQRFFKRVATLQLFVAVWCRKRPRITRIPWVEGTPRKQLPDP